MAADGSGGKSPIEILRERAARAKADAERPRLTEEEQEEAQLRADIARDEETAKAADRARLLLDLARREDVARATLGPDVQFKGIIDDDFGHTYIIRYAGSRPFTAWEKGTQMALLDVRDPKSRQKVSRADVDKTFALASVYDWNGEIITEGTDAYARLGKHFDEYAGAASGLCVAARALSGAALEARKS